MKFLVGFAIVVILVASAAFAQNRTNFGSLERIFAPKSNLWSRWEAHDPASTQRVDHSDWSRFLGKYRSENSLGQARVNYAGVTSADRSGLDAYLASLAATDVDGLNRNEQLSFWINAYNAITVKTVLDNFPVESIRDIPGARRLSPGPWDVPAITISGVNLTLNDIEHRVLRPIWQDPRLHYVLNCAAVGCPNLGAEAFPSTAIDATFDAAARRYVNDPRGVTFNGNNISVSRIYDWFISDFGGRESGVIRHILVYAEPDLANRITAIGRLGGQHYDWSLNMLE